MTRVAGLGESIVVAGGETRVRVHIHTNEPQRFLARVAELGEIERSKIDDMVLQQLAGREAAVGDRHRLDDRPARGRRLPISASWPCRSR